jgi:hypothetical protein
MTFICRWKSPVYQFKGKFRTSGNMGHKATDCKARRDQQQRIETKVICNFCKNPGNHKAENFNLMRKNQNLGNTIQRNGVESATIDIVFRPIKSHDSFKNIWIGESGSSCHYFKSDEGMLDKVKNSKMITFGNGSTIKSEKVRKLRSCVVKCDGRKFEIISENF